MPADVEIAVNAVKHAHELRDAEVGRLLAAACSGDRDENVEAARALKNTTFYMRCPNAVLARVPFGYEVHGERVIAILDKVRVDVAEHRPQVALAPFTGQVGAALCW